MAQTAGRIHDGAGRAQEDFPALDKGKRSDHPAYSYDFGCGPGLVLTNAFVSLRHLPRCRKGLRMDLLHGLHPELCGDQTKIEKSEYSSGPPGECMESAAQASGNKMKLENCSRRLAEAPAGPRRGLHLADIDRLLGLVAHLERGLRADSKHGGRLASFVAVLVGKSV